MVNAFETSKIDQLWTIKNAFLLPESATYYPKDKTIYVSNIVKYAKDGSGFISKVSHEGEILDFKWISALNSPTGLAIYQDKLYAVDMDSLIEIDLQTEKIINRYTTPKSDLKPVLNDVAISKKGDIFVSGSQSRKIYQLRDEKLVVFIDDQKRLLKANGLLVDKETLIHGGQFWNRFSLEDGSLIDNDKSQRPSANLVDFDGITHDGKGGYFVTVIDDSRIWHINAQGTTLPLSQDAIEGIDIHYDIGSKQLFVPQVGGSLTVFTVN
ncbi:SMP-30/gluconolactonase/LRE family protein [Aliikangiella marina]|uniref:SMP-30/gluconolactonase/LRE family protein n=1 Tax=Aliikangiella marina TaxID=1712262 RepID=A0A545TJ71_9GAMM|nr:SMP-30/gluconolactonase/LRE family protein [Aliikangiella marina]TQV77253.1 SMP-30/gluconolactonase/LRE family protein [Aliikangiella marina]